MGNSNIKLKKKMKRVTERSDLASKQVPEYISGCRQFEGEDLSYRQRVQTNAALQKEWVQQQTREHEWNASNEKKEDSEYAEQTENITRMRGMLEDDSTRNKKQQLKELQAYNQRLADDKRQREKDWKNGQEEQNAFEISRTNMSDIMTENEATTTSQLAPHRFVPYHFKGLRKDQVDDILAQRAGQVQENKAQRQNDNSEEYQWAVQNLSNNQ